MTTGTTAKPAPDASGAQPEKRIFRLVFDVEVSGQLAAATAVPEFWRERALQQLGHLPTVPFRHRMTARQVVEALASELGSSYIEEHGNCLVSELTGARCQCLDASVEQIGRAEVHTGAQRRINRLLASHSAAIDNLDAAQVAYKTTKARLKWAGRPMPDCTS